MSTQCALVIATYSQRMRLRLADGSQVGARIKGKRTRPVCGDRVSAQPIPGETDWLITAVRDRDNQLDRPNRRGSTEVLAANIDRVVVMVAATPSPDWSIVDRYFCAAEMMNAGAGVLFNKTDLVAPADVAATLADFARIGYPTICCSIKHRDRLEEVADLLSDGVSIIVGQSGVGKSSLINRLVGEEKRRTAAVSANRDEGRHTTVNSVMLFLPSGGAVIDSPGVRDYAPALRPEQVEFGYREIVRAGRDCRFSDCRHLEEPDCAVRQAVAEQRISRRRYDSYRRLLAWVQFRGQSS